jgi:flagellar motor switch protein FliG
MAMNAEQKAAVLLVALGADMSSQVMKHLKEETVEQLTLQIANMRKVTPAEKDVVLEDCYQMSLAEDALVQGGVDYAKDLLERSLGSHKAVEILNRLQGALQTIPFDFIKRADPHQLLNFIQNEHPQTIALVLAHLGPDSAANILRQLPQEEQVDVTKRIAIMDRATPDVIMEVERVLERKISSVFTQEYAAAGGVRAVAEIMNRMDRSTEKVVMEKMEEETPDLADDIKRLMFVFDDINLLDDRAIQQVMKGVDQKDIVLALKGASESVKGKILKNMSTRAKQMILEDMEVMGPVRLKTAEEAQQKIINVVRRLEETGEIAVARGGGEAEVLV